MKRVVLCAAAVMTMAMAGTRVEDPLVPPPPGAKIAVDAFGQGVQIYTCEAGPAGYRWVFAAPEAALFDTSGRQIGIHFAGPTWQMQDGSKIVGEVAAQAAAPHPPAIGWLLLRVKSHDGNGTLSGVATVRRIDTQGGLAPAGACSATQSGQQARMRYTARYLFYSAP